MLEWSTDALDSPAGQQRQQELAQRAQAEAERRAEQRKDLPGWRHCRALALANLAQAEREAQEAQAAVTRAEVAFLEAVHRPTDGNRPRHNGEVFLGVFFAEPNMAPGQAASPQPGRREHQAVLRAREVAVEAAGRAGRIKGGLEQIEAEIARCEGA